MNSLTSFTPLFREMTRAWLREHDEHHVGPLLGVDMYFVRTESIASDKTFDKRLFLTLTSLSMMSLFPRND